MRKDPRHFPIKAFGIETQVPWWAISALAIIIIVGVTWSVYHKFTEPERAIISLKDANKQLAAEVEEYSLHVMEQPEKHELFEEQDGRLIIRVYKDHCVLIQRQSRRGTRTKLVLDLDRTPIARMQITPSFSLLPVVYAQDACNRGCLNPHPGEFRWWYGRRIGDWIEVWRQWPEGCTHVQLFQPHRGLWDSNPDGTPRVRWTCCVH